MSHPTGNAGFRRKVRNDRIFQEHVHDAYQARAKLPEPAICTQCGAVFHHGRWQWQPHPANALQATCPACQRIHDHFPAGFLTMKGEFFNAHRDEIMHLVRNYEHREQSEHPLKRIIAIEEKSDSALVTTTDIHLARGIGEALHNAYRGKLEFHYNPGQYLLRVHWTH